MLTAPLSALASHDDLGARIVISDADEVDADGNLVPDIPSEDSGLPNARYDEVRFHVNLASDGLPARQQPADQTGDRYTDCQQAGNNPEDNGYFDGLTATGDSCYVGYLDLQLEYVISGWPQLGWNADPLYPVNPGPPNDGHQDNQDAYCRGESETNPVTPDDGVNVIVTRAQRAADGYLGGSNSECGGFNHDFKTEYDVMIDADLLEPAALATPAHGDSETQVAPPGSGYYTLPFGAFQHVFLFGQPHPDTADENLTGLSAAALNDATADLAFPTDNPCGLRTAECTLLSSQDVILYDSNNGPLGLDPGEGSLPRVCSYNPQFGINGGAGLPTECGPQGTPLTALRGDRLSGGLGLEPVTGVPSYLNMVPGWYDDTIIILGLGEGGDILWAGSEMEDVVTDPCCGPGVGVFAEGGQEELGTYNYIAVNPKIPKPSDPTWCVQPGFLTAGDDTVLDAAGFGTFSDPGVYGTYVADAIDTDVRPGTLQNQYLFMQRDLKGPVRDGPVTSPVPLPSDVQGAPLDEDGDDKIGLRELENLGAFITGQNTNVLTLPPAVQELLDRSDFREANDPDPDVPTPATPSTHPLRYSRTLDAGLRCDFQGTLSFNDGSATQEGAVQFNVNVVANSDVPGAAGVSNEWLKDPTAFSDFMGVPLPEGESDTQRNGWQVDHYDFGGITRAQSDTNGNGQFDGCAEPLGQPQPGLDFCGWEAIWDAYNGECENSINEVCSKILDDFGYNRTRGVGLYFVITTDGPTIVENEAADTGDVEAQYQPAGGDDIFATHCIIGTSKGFLPRLMNEHNLDLSVVDSGSDTDAVIDLFDTLCPDADGDRFVFEDAFTDQSPNTGSFASNVQFHKLVPTPDGLDEASQWHGFEVCVNGVWHVADDPDTVGPDIAGDTVDNIELSSDASPHTFQDCDAFDDASENTLSLD